MIEKGGRVQGASDTKRFAIDNMQPATCNLPLPYSELHSHSYFSLLDGASSPEELVSRAKELGLNALALTDHDSLAGAVRFWNAAKRAELHAVIGAEVTLADGHHLTLLAETQQGYANLCSLVTVSRMDVVKSNLPSDVDAEALLQGWLGKVEPSLSWERLAECSQGLIALSGCRQGVLTSPLLRQQREEAYQSADRLLQIFGREQLFVELQHHFLPDDNWLNSQLLDLAAHSGLRVVATNNVHYAFTEKSKLRDALIAIRHNQSLQQARQAGHLPVNSSYALASPQEMARRFRHLPLALQTSVEIAQRCQVSLDFSHKRLPTFHTPDGSSEFAYLYELCHANLPKRYPQLKPQVLKQLAHELDIIERAGLAGYFLIVWDIMRFAREEGIRCQGRGSAANSLVAYLLQITSIDPLAHNLLFERFLSQDKFTMPDIDIDFAADRREEVIQHVYRKYGAAHTAMVCNVNTFQARSAVRDLAIALDFPPTVIDRLAKGLDTHSCSEAAERLEREMGSRRDGEKSQATPSPPISPPPHHPIAQLATLLRQIDGCPRHLSIHSGGMLITGQPLNKVVPLEPATMPGRIVAQWDKDSVEDAGLIKIDLLALRTLGLITEAIDLVTASGETIADIDTLPLDDPELYRMLQRADTIGTFQVESRAQQQMLPRLKPTCFEDIAVEVAIVRPGPIQGGAVHPYLRRRMGVEPVSYLHPLLEPVLKETLGVLLFQEQAIRVAVAAANFAPGEADMLRRALSRNNSEAALAAMRERFCTGAVSNGIDAATAEAIFAQLAGFAGFGFCKSHAMSFALIAYQTLYLKRYHSAAFYCSLLRHQPMGFYSPEVIVGDAKRHGIDLLPPDVNRSQWHYTIELTPNGSTALRTGLNAITGIGEQVWQRIQSARQQADFSHLPDFCRRTRLPQSTISDLIRVGACDVWGQRRQLLWQLGEFDYRPEEFELALPTIPITLPDLSDMEQTSWEYELLGLSPAGQLMRHYREALRKAGILSTWQVKEAKAGQKVSVAGMMVVKQRPATAKGIMFMSLEDEAGLLDLVVKPEIYERFRDVLRKSCLLIFIGVLQHSQTSTSVLITEVDRML